MGRRRGEGTWHPGLLKSTCAHEVPFVEMGMGARNLAETTKQRLPALTFAHQEMQEVVLEAAQAAGAKVRRGVTVDGIEPGSPARVVSGREKMTARLVAGADGRSSACRRARSFTVKEASLPFLLAGVLLTSHSAAEDLVYFIFNNEFGAMVGFIPTGKNRFRTYFSYPKSSGYRLQGEPMLNEFLSESTKAFPGAAKLFEGARCIGPLASFDASESWVEHPYADGVALIGDASATTDPTFGQGLNLTLRDVRVLRDELLKNSDWEAAGHRYAEAHGRYFHPCRTVEGWLRTLFQDPSPESASLRQKAMPLIGQDPSRVPDHLFSGPDLLADDGVRARPFGEC